MNTELSSYIPFKSYNPIAKFIFSIYCICIIPISFILTYIYLFPIFSPILSITLIIIILLVWAYFFSLGIPLKIHIYKDYIELFHLIGKSKINQSDIIDSKYNNSHILEFRIRRLPSTDIFIKLKKNISGIRCWKVNPPGIIPNSNESWRYVGLFTHGINLLIYYSLNPSLNIIYKRPNCN